MAERLTLLNLYSKPCYTTLAKKTFKLIKMEESGLSFYELMDKYNEDIEVRFGNKSDYLTVQESIEVFKDIMKFNSIDQEEFLHKLDEVLNKKRVKLNTFVLEGPKNVRKSMVTRSIAAIPKFVGEVVLSEGSAFNWQNCTKKSLNIF